MSVAAPADRPAPLRPPRRPVSVVAHRGASAYAPENTLPAVELALAMGADTIEVDVQGTADGGLVLLHDTTLARTTDAARVLPGRRPWRVGDLTVAELARLDAGTWFAPTFAGTRVPTLQEVLEVVGGRAALLLEVKRPDLYPTVAARLARALAEAGRPAGAVVVQSFDRGFLEAFHTLAPHVGTGWLRNRVPHDLAAVARWAGHLNLHHRSVTARGLAAAHEQGLRVLPWTVDEPGRMAQLLGLGADGLITNRPDTLLALLRGR